MRLGFLALIAGCRGGLLSIDSGDDTGDTDLSDTDPTDTEDTAPADDPASRLAVEALVGPAAWMVRARAWVDDCATSIGATDWDLSGCDDGDGVVWTGGATFRRVDGGERLMFDGDLASSGPDGELHYDGQILLAEGVLTADHVARDADGDLVYAHAGHTFTGGEEAIRAAGGGTGSYAVGGQVTVAGAGTFLLSGSIAHGGACDREPDGGDLEASGPSSYDFDVEGAEVCDGCVPYTGTRDGEACGF